jgi:prolyl-tRNA editing enzyme YbaK/EbsC (Cys-tRNA(Pro) deacylase)
MSGGQTPDVSRRAAASCLEVTPQPWCADLSLGEAGLAPAGAVIRGTRVILTRGVWGETGFPLKSGGGYAVEVVTRTWPEPVERVAAFLRTAGVEARIEEFFGGTPTARDAAEAVGCELPQIVKSLLFDCDGRSVLVLVPGDRRADRKKIAAATGCAKARIADASEVERATGFVPGAVAPFPLRDVSEVLVERALLTHHLVWFGAGSTSHMAALVPADLARLTGARTVDAVQESA